MLYIQTMTPHNSFSMKCQIATDRQQVNEGREGKVATWSRMLWGPREVSKLEGTWVTREYEYIDATCLWLADCHLTSPWPSDFYVWWLGPQTVRLIHHWSPSTKDSHYCQGSI